jgi:hypothetical protein
MGTRNRWSIGKKAFLNHLPPFWLFGDNGNGLELGTLIVVVSTRVRMQDKCFVPNLITTSGGGRKSGLKSVTSSFPYI